MGSFLAHKVLKLRLISWLKWLPRHFWCWAQLVFRSRYLRCHKQKILSFKLLDNVESSHVRVQLLGIYLYDLIAVLAGYLSFSVIHKQQAEETEYCSAAGHNFRRIIFLVENWLAVPAVATGKIWIRVLLGPRLYHDFTRCGILHHKLLVWYHVRRLHFLNWLVEIWHFHRWQ